MPELNTFRPVTQEELLKLVRMSASKTCMLDPAPTALLKCPVVLKSVLPHMAAAINALLESAEVPGCLKEAVITPILKKQGLDADSMKSYRPVSNIPFLAQVMERVIASRLSNHLTEHGLQDPFQSAYRKGHSTETALLRIQDDIRRALGRGERTLLVLLDLSAAFDTIDHGILPTRLEQVAGLRGAALQCMAEVLPGRPHAVHVLVSMVPGPAQCGLA